MGSSFAWYHACLLLLAEVFLPQLPAQGEAQDRLWTYRTQGGYVDSSPSVGDVDGDGRKEIIVTTTSGLVIALDAQGGERWRAPMGGLFSIAPTLADVAGDAAPEVLALSNAGRLWCLDGTAGAVRWDYPLGGTVAWGSTAVAAADMNGDHALEIIAANSQGMMVCLTGEAMTLWNYVEPSGFNSAPAVGDLDQDGDCELVIGTGTTPLLCIDGDGKACWRVQGRKPVGSSPVLWDLDADGTLEILVGTGTQIAAFRNDGSLLWGWDMKREVDSAIAVGDADEDGRPEIYAVDLSGLLVCLTPGGKALWTASVEERARRSPSLADVDGDGAVEVLVGGYSKAIHMFDARGNLKERIAVDGSMNATPTVADLVGDGRLCVVCPVKSGDTGEVIALQTWKGGITNPRILWPEYRFNATRTGTAVPVGAKPKVEIARMDSGKGYVGSNSFSVQVRNPERKPLTVRLQIARDSAHTSKSTHPSSEPAGDFSLPYVVSGDKPVTFIFSCEVLDGTNLVATRSSTLRVVPFERELGELAGNCTQLERQLARMLHARATKDRASCLRTSAQELRGRAADASAMADVARLSLRDDLARARAESARLLTQVKAANEAENGLAAWAANPWAPFGGMNEIEEGRTGSAALVVEAFPGETESAALNVFNLNDGTKTFRVTLDPLTQSAEAAPVPPYKVVTLRETVAVPAFTMDLSSDALPELNQAQTLLVPAWDARQLWLTVRTGALAPGAWKTRVHLRPLTVDAGDVVVELNIQVWETPFPGEQSLRLCHWGFVHTSVLKDQPEAALDDQVSHGTNVFVSLFSPKAAFDAEGRLVGPIDFSAHDEYVRKHAPHGIILFLSYQGALTGLAAEFTPAWKKAHIEWLRAWVAHLAELGMGYDAFALYPVDEPGLSPGSADRFIEYAKVVREADPKIRIYTDPVGGATLDELRRMTPYVDIWCPHRNACLYPDGAERLALMKATGKTIWTYECLGKTKHQTPLGYYRGQAWLAWQHGLTGIGFWSYCTAQDDPWFRSVSGDEYLLIYPGRGVVTSKRWEAVRDGVEDYTLLALLRAAADEAEAKGTNAEVVTRARQVLGEKAACIATFCSQQEGPVPPAFTGTSADRILADEQWAEVQAVRREVASVLGILRPARAR